MKKILNVYYMGKREMMSLMMTSYYETYFIFLRHWKQYRNFDCVLRTKSLAN